MPYIPEEITIFTAPKVRCKVCGAFVRRGNEDKGLCSRHQPIVEEVLPHSRPGRPCKRAGCEKLVYGRESKQYCSDKCRNDQWAEVQYKRKKEDQCTSNPST